MSAYREPAFPPTHPGEPPRAAWAQRSLPWIVGLAAVAATLAALAMAPPTGDCGCRSYDVLDGDRIRLILCAPATAAGAVLATFCLVAVGLFVVAALLARLNGGRRSAGPTA